MKMATFRIFCQKPTIFKLILKFHFESYSVITDILVAIFPKVTKCHQNVYIIIKLSVTTCHQHQCDFKITLGYIDVGDGCWRPNMLMTSLRCCLPIQYVGDRFKTLRKWPIYRKTSPTQWFCHQYLKSVTIIKSPI